MSLRNTISSTAMSFAHLAGIGRAKPGARAGKVEDEDPKPDAEDDDPKPDAEDEDPKPDAEDEDPKPDAEDEDPKPDAEDEDEKPEASDDDGDDNQNEPKQRKGKASAKAASADFKRGRKSERHRCAAIFASPLAARNTALAAHLAFNTGLSSKAALGILKDTPAGSTAASQSRERSNPRVGQDGGRTGPGAAAKGWDVAMNKAGVKTTTR